MVDNLKRRGSDLNLPRLSQAGVNFFHADIRCREDFEALPSFDLLIDCSAEPSVQVGLDGAPDPVEDHRRGNIPVAFVVTDESRPILEQDIKDFVLANAPANMHPRHIIFLEALPLAATNKIDRKKLAGIAKQKAGNTT